MNNVFVKALENWLWVGSKHVWIMLLNILLTFDGLKVIYYGLNVIFDEFVFG